MGAFHENCERGLRARDRVVQRVALNRIDLPAGRTGDWPRPALPSIRPSSYHVRYAFTGGTDGAKPAAALIRRSV